MPRVWQPEAESGGSAKGGTTWSEIYAHWNAVVLDFQEQYFVDLEDVAGARCWHWFRRRVLALLDAPVRAVAPNGKLLPATRLQRALWPKD